MPSSQSGVIFLVTGSLPPIGVAALANADFERTKAAADRFQRNELRIMGRLLLAQAPLREDKQTAANEK